MLTSDRDQKVQRTLGITDGTQDIGAHIVEHLRDHAQKVDAQIQRCIGQNLVRRAQQTHHRRSGHKAQHGQQCANGSAQHQRRVHGACRREGKTFISVDPEHLQILL